MVWFCFVFHRKTKPLQKRESGIRRLDPRAFAGVTADCWGHEHTNRSRMHEQLEVMVLNCAAWNRGYIFYRKHRLHLPLSSTVFHTRTPLPYPPLHTWKRPKKRLKAPQQIKKPNLGFQPLKNFLICFRLEQGRKSLFSGPPPTSPDPKLQGVDLSKLLKLKKFFR